MECHIHPFLRHQPRMSPCRFRVVVAGHARSAGGLQRTVQPCGSPPQLQQRPMNGATPGPVPPEANHCCHFLLRSRKSQRQPTTRTSDMQPQRPVVAQPLRLAPGVPRFWGGRQPRNRRTYVSTEGTRRLSGGRGVRKDNNSVQDQRRGRRKWRK